MRQRSPGLPHRTHPHQEAPHVPFHATVLFEVRGQTQSWGAKKKGQLVKAVETGLMGIVTSVANDSVTELDPTRYDDIPPTTYPQN